jgi:hypothetical protein
MLPDEILMFKRYVSYATKYSEFGSGGSTVYVDGCPNIKEIVSIESDDVFAKKVSSKCNRTEVRHIDIGPAYNWGHPSDTSTKPRWPNYSRADIGTPDLILVDSRFRVACILQVCLSHSNSILIVHDFWNRSEYHCVLPFLDVIDRVDSLLVAKVKTSNDRGKLQELYEEYKENSD